MTDALSLAVLRLRGTVQTSQMEHATLRQFYDWMRAYYAPSAIARRQFNAWIRSEDGKNFKQGLHFKQLGRCKRCRCKRNVNEFHVDHIKPLSKYPMLATRRSNLQLLCPPCNLTKGSNTSAPPAGQSKSRRSEKSSARKTRSRRSTRRRRKGHRSA